MKLLYTVFVFSLCVGVFSMSWAAEIEPGKRYTFYLTGSRMCKKCRWKPVSGDRIELVNKDGLVGVYHRSEILGVARYRWLAKVFGHSLKEIGMPGEVLVTDDPMAPTAR